MKFRPLAPLMLSGCGWGLFSTEEPTVTAPPVSSVAAERTDPVPEGPNVVLIIGCTVRKDQLSPYGGPEGLTPFLDGMAERGALFETAIDAAPWTRPGHTAVLTGHHAAEIGMVEPSYAVNSRHLSDQVTTIAEHLYGAGYATIGLTANPNLNAVFGFAQGFEQYYEGSGLWRDVGTVKVPGKQMAETAAQMVDQIPDGRPFYLQMTLVDAHEPYPRNPGEARQLQPEGAPDKVGAYRVGLRRFDSAIQHLHAVLGARGFTDENTIFMVVNDHGEGIKWPTEAHSREHGYALYESSVGMPWIVTGPTIHSSHRIQGMASQVDVLPTINGLIGVQGYEGPGHSWAKQLRGALRTSRERAWVDTWFWEVERSAIYTEQRACFYHFSEPRRVRHKHPSPYCYDRLTDPHGLEPVGPDEALLGELKDWHAGLVSRYQAWPHTANSNMDESVASQLEALGYIEPE